MNSICADIASKGVLVSDGAWGTFLFASGLEPGECPEAWNLERPDVVASIAAIYVEAGAQVVTTNSFGGTRMMLERHGLAEKTAAINEAAAALSRKAGAGIHVAASMGPSGKFLITGETTEEELYGAFKEQAIALEKGGANACNIETMAALDEARIAIKAAKENTQLEVIASFTFNAAAGMYNTMMGVTPEAMAAGVLEAGADIIGCNCTLGPDEMLGLVAALHAAAPDAPILVHPNAGQPIQGENGTTYPIGPEEFAAFVPRFVDAGAKIIGGCCGTTPEHIQAIRTALS